MTASLRYSLLLTIDIIRRDPLAPGVVVSSVLTDPELITEPEPVPAAVGWPGIGLGND